MCIDVALGGRKPYGFLFKNDLNEFVYSCSRCDEEFRIGNDLEVHSIGHDVKKENEIVINPEISLNLQPIEVYQPHFTSIESAKDDVNPLSGSVEEKALDFYSFNHVKLEVNNLSNESGAESTGLLSEGIHSTGCQNESSSLEDSTISKSKKTKRKKSTKKDEYHCDICARVFTSLARIQQHMDARHTKPAKRPPSPQLCSICGKYIRAMKMHLKIFHSTERPFKCDYCDASFKRKAHRDIHKRQHTGEKPYVNQSEMFRFFMKSLRKVSENHEIHTFFSFLGNFSQICHLCGRTYLTQTILSSHVNQSHLNLKPHKCDQCENAYRQQYQLKDHINLHHLNQKLYRCEICDRRFGTRKHLKQHMLSHGEKKYKCKFCDQKFATTSGRRGHEIRNHGAT